MILAFQILAGLWLAYLILELGCFWAVLLATPAGLSMEPLAHSRRSGDTCDSKNVNLEEVQPRIVVLSACRDGAACLPGLADTFKAQTYPADRFKLVLIADHCKDDSASVGRTLGMEVYERQNPSPSGKGNSIADILQNKLRHEAFDLLVVLDVDGRVHPDFLEKVAAHANASFATHRAIAFSGATYAKNPTDSPLAQVGDMIQGVLRLHQVGRSGLGLGAVFYGSHGYILSRPALERLEWRTHTGLQAEDMELRLRCALADIEVIYARDLAMYNEVPVHRADAREQRRRWNAIYPPLISDYFRPLLRKALHGSASTWDILFGVLLLPSFANLFLYLGLSTFLFGSFSFFWPLWRSWALLTGWLWFLDLLYLICMLYVSGATFSLRALRGLLEYLGVRISAMVEGLFYLRVKDWAAAAHQEDKWSKPS